MGKNFFELRFLVCAEQCLHQKFIPKSRFAPKIYIKNINGHHLRAMFAPKIYIKMVEKQWFAPKIYIKTIEKQCLHQKFIPKFRLY